MPFYLRIPLPGPFGYSARIGGRKRRRRTRRRTYSGQFGTWQCSHKHATPQAATRCALGRKLDEYTQVELRLKAAQAHASPSERQAHAQQAARIALAKHEVRMQMRGL
jgi:hypothetical protein